MATVPQRKQVSCWLGGGWKRAVGLGIADTAYRGWASPSALSRREKG
jgi:hypothetical protein